jgi:hypothetical protein
MVKCIKIKYESSECVIYNYNLAIIQGLT